MAFCLHSSNSSVIWPASKPCPAQSDIVSCTAIFAPTLGLTIPSSLYYYSLWRRVFIQNLYIEQISHFVFPHSHINVFPAEINFCQGLRLVCRLSHFLFACLFHFENIIQSEWQIRYLWIWKCDFILLMLQFLSSSMVANVILYFKMF